MFLQKIRRALITVSEKEGVTAFAKVLKEHSIEIFATGGTYVALQSAGIQPNRIDEIVRYPEMIDGRVKTLQPEIFAGILAKRVEQHLIQLREMKVDPMDMVVCNFYPFEKIMMEKNVEYNTLVENIDIGGPSLVRAAAKNSEYVTVVPSPQFYDVVSDELQLNNGSTSLKLRRKLGQAAFNIVSSYDIAICNGMRRFDDSNDFFPDNLFISAHRFEETKYGENPGQRAAIYRLDGYTGMADWIQLYGEKKSFNNHLDVGGAYSILDGFNDHSTVATVKHGQTSGFAFAPTLAEAYMLAHSCDPEADFGGTVVLNREVDVEVAKLIGKNEGIDDESIYTEIVIAPSYTAEALDILKNKQRKKMRLMQVKAKSDYTHDVKILEGAMLVQEQPDYIRKLGKDGLTFPTKAKIDNENLAKLLVAWEVVRKIESNGIVVGDGKYLGGTLTAFWTYGVASFRKRNGAVEIAIDNAGERSRGAVVASDGFFPFRDSIDLLGKAEIKSIIQPGGSINDSKIVEAADEYNIAMVFTHTRAFKH